MHRAGGKITGSHTTVIATSALVVDNAEKMQEVRKIVLGIIKKGSSKKRRLKFKAVPAGWQVVVYGPSFFQELYIYVSLEDKWRVKRELEKLF
ncbi:hypothetical protein COY25_00255 [Candidatus Uhrbacteria bacterium CG_4_10_14_0_2_um_filter_41_7]|uniref:Uncharacterized protein n=1 Tax=Candidatus Uhrbacteria bacterium CG_4_9_14_3_um_filter_41_35 TaxID=1975034 RepID=A0A2M7XD72_9BACT|nr:MAG: hypothetical protein COV92_04140 [Candidatus Uhrbacteria bacterium CG11_big_fil_rev_8_21_14_0_20_41_9]PIZ55795.1 MAG: hypothetical protein COY25_00255 [Candidatus Uhrbacteria bacterium CG_4_10_14_0_2_um_filter_41_7]PJA45814.1 MAG: hypothetical protein CO173_04560 [Candidatus Uhrbacteria bacterium CG_4_9_14_3_um_filter_41_35]